MPLILRTPDSTGMWRGSLSEMQPLGCASIRAALLCNLEVAYCVRSYREAHRAQSSGFARVAGADRLSGVRRVVPGEARRPVRAGPGLARAYYVPGVRASPVGIFGAGHGTGEAVLLHVASLRDRSKRGLLRG